ncbi:hypothetical protein HY772_08560 [Candidatus Woesearchaeota archaeon]|nr:hypothetical protein [Candidatus Woesearchaeota archaeon]
MKREWSNEAGVKQRSEREALNGRCAGVLLRKWRKLKKNGVFFTVIAVIVVGFFLVSFGLFASYRDVLRTSVLETRVFTMNNFIKNIDDDMERSLYISGFRALLSLVNDVVTTGVFVSNLSTQFSEVIYNGTINGTAQDLMQNNTLLYWTQKIQEESAKINLNTTIRVGSLLIDQSDPWMVLLTMEANVSIVDKDGAASWNVSRTVQARIPIEGFEDPFFVVKTGGLLSRKVFRTNLTLWNVTHLRTHLKNETYLNNSNAPNFLLRLQGSTAASNNGIETLIDTNDLIQVGISVLNKTSVDYIYWSTNNPGHYGITGITNVDYPKFRLDSAHLSVYNVTNQSYS